MAAATLISVELLAELLTRSSGETMSILTKTF
jgi:hypothetical protein